MQIYCQAQSEFAEWISR